MKIIKIPSLQRNKQFIIENRPFLMGILLFKYPKLNQKLIMLIKELFIKIFNSNKMSVEPFYKNIITSLFDKAE